MNWEATGAIGQLLGSIATVLTLVYLAAQVRHARAEIGRALNLNRFDAARELAMNRANNVRLAASREKYNIALGGNPFPFVSELVARTGAAMEEAVAINHDEFAWWMFRTRVIDYLDDLSPRERLDFERILRQVYGSDPISSLWWETQKAGFATHAVQYVDGLIARTG